MTTGRRHYTMGGFSLVELMISLALGAVLTVGIIQLFAANWIPTIYCKASRASRSPRALR